VLGDLLMNTIGEGKDALKYVLFDSSSDLKGIELMGPILQAIKLHQCIAFDYSKFNEDSTEYHEMEPYALKEFQGRWYVVGTVSGSKKLYIFGLDRIDKLGIMTQTFVPKKTIDPTLEFEEIIGVTRLDEDMEDVVLSFTPRQGNYVKTFPWHRSQEVLVDDETELRTRIRVRPNFELTQRILMQGRSVEVIAPDWLRMEIKENLQKTIERYSQATTGNGERII
jgi:predicted DNA-binding transcriptional regulator YafY